RRVLFRSLTLLRSAFISSALRINSRRLSSSDNTSSTTFVSIPRFATLSFKNSGSLRNSLMSNMSFSILSISIFLRIEHKKDHIPVQGTWSLRVATLFNSQKRLHFHQNNG